MNSRADAGDGGFPVPQDKQIQREFQFMGSWIPVTPEKPVQARSSLITDGRDVSQVGRVSSKGPNGFPGGDGYSERALYSNGAVQNLEQTQQLMSRNGGYYHDANVGLARRNRLINCIAGSYAQTRNNNEMENLLARNNAASPLAPVNRNPIENVDMVNRKPADVGTVNDSFIQSGSQAGNCREFDLDNLLFSDQIPCSFSSLLSDGDNLCQGLQYGISASNRPFYNLNSPPRREANGSCSATSFNFVPPMPDHANNTDNGTTSGSEFPAGNILVQEKGHLENRVTTAGNELIQHNSDKDLHNIADLSVVDSTKEQRDGNRQNDPVIDLNKTPQLKPPKRKKYMPKVVVEGKPKKKTQKPAILANAKSKETGSAKRKQAQKTSLKESAIKEPDAFRDTSDLSPEIPARSCRRALNFDLEKTGDERQGNSESHQNACGSNSDYETRAAISGIDSSCISSVTWIDQQIGILIGKQPAGLSAGKQPAGLPIGEKQPGLQMGNQPDRLPAGDQRPGLLMGTRQPRFLIGSQQCRFPMVNKQTQFSMGNQQPQFSVENQPLGLPVGKQQPLLPIGNRQPRLPMGNQQPGYLIGNQQPGLSTGNQQSGCLTGNRQSGFLNQQNQQAFLPIGGRQSGLPIGIHQPGLSRGTQQPGLVMKNWQPGVLMRNQQPGSLMRNQQAESSVRSQQPGLTMRNQQPGLLMRNQQPGTLGSFPSCLNQIAACMSLPEDRVSQSLSQTHVTKLHAEILKNISRNMRTRTAGTCLRNSNTTYSSLQQNIRQGNGYMEFQGRYSGETLDGSSKTISQNVPPPALSILPKPFETRGSKREYDHATWQMQNHDMNTAGRPSSLQQIAQSRELERRSSYMGAAFSEAQKKTKIQDGLHAKRPGMPCEVIEIEDGPDDALQKGLNNVKVNEFASKGNSSPVQSKANNEKCIIVPPTPPRKAPALRDQLVVPFAHASEIKILESTQAKPSSSRIRAKEKRKRTLQHSGKARGPSREPLNQDSVAEIMHKLQNLNLDDKTSDQMEQNALVLYQGDGAVVPYEIKKRKPRPKVDLDQETTRIWNLLMGKGESQGDRDMDKEKEQWWEEERRVFRGRADSFIARMHLVQGDRRFSPWKGSVVDSVIGVFLTQNVTDHLSSSAFMSLAARFPPKSNCNQAEERNITSIIVEDPEGCILNLNDIPAWQEKIIHHPPDTPVSGVESGSREQQRDSSNSGVERICFAENCSQNLEEEVLSSQDSFDPAIFQSNGGVGSCSGSTSDAEFSTTRCEQKSVSGSVKLLQIGDHTLSDEIYCQGDGRPLLCEGSENLQVQETANNAQQMPRADRISNCKDSFSFCQTNNHNNWQMDVPANPSTAYQRNMIPQLHLLDIEDFGMHSGGNGYSWLSIAPRIDEGNNQRELHRRVRQAGNVAVRSMGQNEKPMPQETPGLGLYISSSKHQMHQGDIRIPGSHLQYNQLCNTQQKEINKTSQSQCTFTDLLNSADECLTRQFNTAQHNPDALLLKERTPHAAEVINPHNKNANLENKLVESNSTNEDHLTVEYKDTNSSILQEKKGKPNDGKKSTSHWDSLRKDAEPNGRRKERSKDTMDSIDYEAIRDASVSEISEAIKERGMNNMLAVRIKEFLDRLVKDHGSVDLEWLRDVPPDKAKDYLLSIRGLGLKSVECVRLLTLHNLAFPVDTNVGRIAVRLGWVPLQPLPESLQLHLLELYPVLESIQKYLWPRLCKLDQRTLYELHYQLITFGKVFCTKSKPNCNSCPMRGECRHFASAFASARLALPAPEERSLTSSTIPVASQTSATTVIPAMQLPPPEENIRRDASNGRNCEPIIEEPATPEQEGPEVTESDIEDAYYEDPDEIPTIKLNIEEFGANLQQYMELQEADMSKALVALDQSAASIPTAKLKNISRLRTEHQVYELPDSHPLLDSMDKREPDDPSPYLLAIWTPGETAHSTQLPERKCEWQEPGKLCNDETCSACNSVREANSHTVRGTLLIPCRTAMRGSFPLNGTYFQVNEVFADHNSSLNPIDVPRDWIWNLPRRIVYFGTSVTSIFRGLSTEQIQYCFWKGFVCVRGFDQKTRAPRPLVARLHFPASKLKAKTEGTK